jgi:hypothetical protein
LLFFALIVLPRVPAEQARQQAMRLLQDEAEYDAYGRGSTRARHAALRALPDRSGAVPAQRRKAIRRKRRTDVGRTQPFASTRFLAAEILSGNRNQQQHESGEAAQVHKVVSSCGPNKIDAVWPAANKRKEIAKAARLSFARHRWFGRIELLQRRDHLVQGGITGQITKSVCFFDDQPGIGQVAERLRDHADAAAQFFDEIGGTPD